MKSNFALALMTGATTLAGISTAQAVMTNRAECYTAVTNACNKKKSDEAIAACNNNGHNQCDKQFPAGQIEPQTPVNFRGATTMKQGS